ncbi:hypothetical protein SEUCBS139899_008037 [Sporothrix eucalyptigena]|uniref:Uncharacterized protein n=1 Tax=Sporothrix eucalyptigena TaxID=1812306 RepID=A0ABP0D3J9_9PEZI
MSSTTKDTPAAKPSGMSDRDVDMLIKVFKCFKTAPEIDFEKMSKECELSNKKHASTVWYRLKKKMFPDGMPVSTANGDDAEGSTASPNSGKKRQAATKKTSAKANTTDDTAGVEDGDDKDADNKDTKAKDGADAGNTTPVTKSGAEANGNDADNNNDDDASQGSPNKRRRGANAANGSPKATRSPRAQRASRAPKSPKSPKAAKEAKEAKANTLRAAAKETPKSDATANDDESESGDGNDNTNGTAAGDSATDVLAQIATLAAAVPKDAVDNGDGAAAEVKDTIMTDSVTVIEGVV